MRNVKYFLAVVVFYLISFECKSQESAMRVKIYGYVIDIGDHILFQPMDSFREFSLEVLDNRSFKLGNLSSDEIPVESFKNLGDTISIELHNNTMNKSYKYSCRYFYSAIVIDLCIFDTLDKPKYFNPTKYNIVKNGRTFPCYGYFVNNRIIQMIPQKRSVFNSFCEFYRTNHYKLPQFLILETLYHKPVHKTDR